MEVYLQFQNWSFLFQAFIFDSETSHHMIDVQLHIDTSQFEQMISELAQAVPGKSEQEVLREEVGKALEQSVRNTAAMQVQKVVQRSERSKFTTMPASLYKPRTVKRDRSGNVVYFLGNRYPNALWQAIQKRRRQDLAKKIKARGLAKKSWYLIAEKLGIRINVPSYVQNAVATTGKAYFEDIEATERYDKDLLEIKIRNEQPTVNSVGGEQVLQQAIDGRVKFFIQNMSRAVFDSLEKISRKYPGLIVKENGS